MVGLCPDSFIPSYVNSKVYSKHFLIFFWLFLITCFLFPTPSFMFPVFTSQVSYSPQAPSSGSAFEGTLEGTHSIGLCWVHLSLSPWSTLLPPGDMKCCGPHRLLMLRPLACALRCPGPSTAFCRYFCRVGGNTLRKRQLPRSHTWIPKPTHHFPLPPAGASQAGN